MTLLFESKLVRRCFCCALFALATTAANAVSAETLSLQRAEQIALRDEPGILGLDAKTQSMMENSVAEGELMDPMLQVGVLNLPTDTFDFDQEAMTQFKVSYIQQFPSGDSLEISRDKAVSQSRQFQYQVEARKRQLLMQVRLSFLETLYWEKARDTVAQNRQLVGQLAEFVQSQFSVGRSNQFEFITVQQRLGKLDDRITQIDQNISAERYQLSEWVGEENSRLPLDDDLSVLQPDSLPQLDVEQINSSIAQHPTVEELNNRIDVSRKDLDLIRESEEPGWGLNISYAYRADAPDGTERPDFFSAMVTFDLPLFTENRQEKRYRAQQYDIESSQYQRDALLRKLRANVLRLQTNLELLQQRDALYQDTLVPQAEQRSRAALQTYQSGKGDFAEVMRAYMEALDIQLEQKRIQIDGLKSRANLLYFVEASPGARQQY